MPTDCISYQNSGYFTKLITDYLNQVEDLRPLYNRFPSIENFEEQIIEKQQNYNSNIREVLVSELQEQYSQLETSDLTKYNLLQLANETTFTVTTGHQLNLFTGPLYFIYKIVSTINLAKALKAKYPTYHFVPIYWMATEDHDFEEINYFNFKGKKIRWNTESTGPVGRLATEGLEKVMEVINLELGAGTNAEFLKTLFNEAYLNHENLADATRYLANALFKDQGLVILDADSAKLKQAFIPYMKQELIEQTSHQWISETIEKLKKYTIQVTPRALNLFYIEDKLRERIVFEDGIYKVNHTPLQFTENEIIAELENHPEKFSPNVIIRPLYQEVVLPNLCYIGGAGEIAYWLELKSYFDSAKVCFPILLVRNSVVLVTEKQLKKAKNLDLSWKDLFLKQADVLNQQTKKYSEFPIDFSEQKAFLKNQFETMYHLSKKTDASFLGAVKAQEIKQIKGLENLEKRLLKAQKRKYYDELERIKTLQNELFPNQSLQERKNNFSEMYLQNNKLIDKCLQELDPLSSYFDILTL
jgi:bacillithiol biosynthesis cysteine-adding enzyme BshC